MISYDDFAKLDIRIGTILSVEVIENADKLLKLSVDLGLKPVGATTGSPDHPPVADGLGEERDIRQVVSGIREYFSDPQSLVGKQCPFLANLAPRVIRGLESQGMILAASSEDKFGLLIPHQALPPGAKVK